ncbi:MAG: hypothetical protein RLY71_2307 [Pseudomonadota bacterium]|jgi:hypothetical protein
MSITIPGIGSGAPGVRTVRASNVDETLLSHHLPPMTARALAEAAAVHDTGAIDRITDQLAEEGVVRRRGDASLLEQLRAGCQS